MRQYETKCTSSSDTKSLIYFHLEMLFTSKSTQTIRCAMSFDIFLLSDRFDIESLESTEAHGLKTEKLWAGDTGGYRLSRCDDTQARVRTLKPETQAALHMCARILPSSERECRKYQRRPTVTAGQRQSEVNDLEEDAWYLPGLLVIYEDYLIEFNSVIIVITHRHFLRLLTITTAHPGTASHFNRYYFY